MNHAGRWLPVLSLLAVACGGGSDPSSGAARLEIVAGNNQSAPVGTAVPVDPAVLATDEAGNPVSGVRVTFTPTAGSGSVSGGVVTTNAQGVATVGSWTLGNTAGQVTLSAAAVGAVPVSIHATATPGTPVRVVAVTPVTQAAVVGTSVTPDPAVRVEDQFGNGVPGVSVQFAVTAGGGSVSGASQVTSSSGVATVGDWTLGPSAGTNRLTATVQLSGLTGNPVTFTATGSSSAYAITLRFLSGMTPAQLAAFQNAQGRLQQVVIGDITDLPVNLPAGQCLQNQPSTSETVDDLLIFVEVVAIDGPGGILGQAGPCVIRSGSQLPLVGIMQFDTDDLSSLQQSGLLQPVILHEMLHVVGFGAVWGNKGLLSGGATTDPFFTGAQAIASFNSIGGNAFVGNRVPVEGTGGPGTRNSHWRDTVFKNELMTGFINAGSNPLSVVTVSSLADLGYTVDTTAADPFVIAPPFVAPPAVAGAGRLVLDDLWRGPLFEAGPLGRLQPVSRR